MKEIDPFVALIVSAVAVATRSAYFALRFPGFRLRHLIDGRELKYSAFIHLGELQRLTSDPECRSGDECIGHPFRTSDLARVEAHRRSIAADAGLPGACSPSQSP